LKTSYHDQVERGRQLLDLHGLSDWHLSIENLHNRCLYGQSCGGTLGHCDRENKTIRIHSPVRGSFRQTLLHEIAHALTPADGHGEEWRRKAEEIGCTAAGLQIYRLIAADHRIKSE
jgi:hypothetical protein